MKSALKLFAVIALLSGPAFAGSIGVHGGINIASVSGGVGSTTKFIGGAFYDHAFDDMFGLMIEADYKGAGGVDYIVLPIQLKVAFNAGGVKPFLLIGPEVGFKISSAPAVQTFDFLAVAGGGVAFEVTPTITAHVLGRYELGFIEVVTGSGAKNRGIHIMGGASFKL